MARPLVRAVFALLVVATVAAFFVTQQLKSETPLVLRFAAQPKQFSPNGDRYRDTTEVGFDLSEPAAVTFSIMDGEGNEVRRIVDNRALGGDENAVLLTQVLRVPGAYQFKDPRAPFLCRLLLDNAATI